MPRYPLTTALAAALLALTACATYLEPEPVMISPEAAMDAAGAAHPSEAAKSRAATAANPGARAGVLTAGDIDDTLNTAAFARYLSKASREIGHTRGALGAPMAVQLVDATNGTAAPGLRVTLSRGGSTFYDGYSGVDGRITVYPASRGAGRAQTATLKVFDAAGQVRTTQTIRAGHKRQQLRIAGATGWQPQFLDLAFVIDTTGSMGDELDWLKKDLRRIVNRARARAPGVDIRLGLVVYRDHGDAYVVRNFGFTKDMGQMRRWLRAQSAQGGGNYPEAAAAALRSAVDLNWRRGQGERLLFHIADAPPHSRDARAYLAAARRGAAKQVQIFGLGASGVAAESEFLMRQAAAMTEGRYLFLTDDSGVGYAHAEPTVSCYLVTRLSGLMTRVIGSELSGTRIEPGEGDILRRVGSYDRGACRN